MMVGLVNSQLTEEDMVNFALVDFTIEMRDHELTVDEGVEDNTEVICMTLDIVGGGSVECELTVGLSPAEGTASMSYFHHKGIYSVSLTLHWHRFGPRERGLCRR